MNKELQNYNKALELLEQCKDEDFSDEPTGCSLERVKEAESILDLQLPQTYVDFLLKWGSLSFGGQEVEGIPFDDIKKSLMLKWTIDEREYWRMPRDLVIIHDTGMDGERYCLKINKENPDLSPVVSYLHPEWPMPVLWENFGTFLLALVEAEIKNQKSFKNEESP